MSAKKAIIVGAGIGGMATAIRLARAGFYVTIIEKNPRVGGKMYEKETDGYRWDMGPSVITMRHVLEELFASAGRKMSDYLTLLPIEPLTRYFYSDGIILDASRDWPQMATAIKQLDERDVEGYLRYLAYSAQIHRITGPIFIYDQAPTWRSFARVPLSDWLKADPFRSMSGAIAQFVRSPHLRQLLGRFATYVGGSPYSAPATLNVIAHVELTGGVWYPRGGIYSIAKALKNLGDEIGVEYRCGIGIKQILLQGDEAIGVEMNNGETLTADVVVSNVDVATTYHQLLPPRALRRQYTTYDPSCSGYILLFGVDKTHPQLAHHNVFFSTDYRAEFDAIFKHRILPLDPTVYVSITSKTDPDHAPMNHENWFVLVNAPPIHDKADWETWAPLYRQRIFDKLKHFGLDITNHITVEHCLTPIDLASISGAWQGALYGPSPNNRMAAFRRPPLRAPHIKRLYFVGGTTHPGGGVPMVILSAKATVELIMKQLT